MFSYLVLSRYATWCAGLMSNGWAVNAVSTQSDSEVAFSVILSRSFTKKLNFTVHLCLWVLVNVEIRPLLAPRTESENTEREHTGSAILWQGK